MSKARELSKLLSGTLKVGALQAPAGTTAQRPSGQVGLIRYNSETGKNEVYDSSGWGAIAAPPQITTVSPASFNGETGTTFTINGSFFDVGAVVKFIDNANNEYTAATVVRVTNSQLTATTPQDFTVAQEPLKVKVINPSGLSYTIENAIDCGGTPSWNTVAGTIATVWDAEDSYTTVATLSATDPDAGATVTYGIVSGTLPTGMSLNTSSGVISGDPSDVSSITTSNFTAQALDNAGNTTQRAFSIVVKPNVKSMFQPSGTTRLIAIGFDGQSNQNTGTNSTTNNGTLTYNAGGPANKRDALYYASGWSSSNNILMSIGNGGLVDGLNLTFIAWYKGTQTNARSGSWSPAIPVFGDPRGSVYIGCGIDAGKISIVMDSIVRGTADVADNNWHMLTYVHKSNNTMDAYVDGSLQISGMNVNNYNGNRRLDYIGAGYWYNDSYPPSNLDAIQVYQGALTQAQIQQIYNGR